MCALFYFFIISSGAPRGGGGEREPTKEPPTNAREKASAVNDTITADTHAGATEGEDVVAGKAVRRVTTYPYSSAWLNAFRVDPSLCFERKLPPLFFCAVLAER